MGKFRRLFRKAFRRSFGVIGNAKPAATNDPPSLDLVAFQRNVDHGPASSTLSTATGPRPIVNSPEHSQATFIPARRVLDVGDGPIDGHGRDTLSIQTHRIPQTYDTDGPTRSPTGSRASGIPSPSTYSGGMLHNASSFIIKESVFGEHVEVRHSSSVLEKMMEYIIPGAEFDSSDRDDPPRCHPNTRTDFLQQLQTHIHDTSLGTRIIWLVGPAGVGKTAIMQTLAEIESPLSTCATLFFSRPNQRDDPRRAFTTLAYRFAAVDPEYRHYIGEKLAADPGFLARSVEEQFKRLFITPFTTKLSTSQRWVVFLDGLDECNGEKQQCRIIDLIHNSVLHYHQATPFIWIIASRPEAHLQAAFTQVKEEIGGFWKLEVPIDSDDALRSVELYLRVEFTKIRRNYSDVVPLLWPTEGDFLRLTLASSGLFVFASTLINYIGEEDPVVRLQHILFLIRRSAASRGRSHHELKANPFQALDLLYSKIMSDIPSNSLPITKTVLAFYLLVIIVPKPREPHVEKPADLLLVCNILGLEQHTVYAALRKLHSVLAFPPPQEAGQNTVRFLHASFSDFLKDKSRSQSYCIDLDRELARIWRCYVKILKSAPSQPHLDGTALSWKASGMTSCDFRRTLLRRARNKWLNILTECCHGITCKHEQQYRLMLSASELIEIFEEFTPIIFENEHLNVEGFCHWLFNHAPVAFRQTMILREFDLKQLNERDLDNMFTGLRMRKWGCYVTESSWRLIGLDLADLNTDRWNEVKQSARNRAGSSDYLEETRSQVHWSILGGLFRLKSAEYGDIKVIILGMKPTYYTVIGPVNDHPSFAKDDIQYLIFPHVETHSSWSKGPAFGGAKT